jgi:hypothetical protein
MPQSDSTGKSLCRDKGPAEPLTPLNQLNDRDKELALNSDDEMLWLQTTQKGNRYLIWIQMQIQISKNGKLNFRVSYFIRNYGLNPQLLQLFFGSLAST